LEKWGTALILRQLVMGAALLGLAVTAAAADDSTKSNPPAAYVPAKGKRQALRTPPPSGECCPSCCEIYRYVYAEAWYGSGKVVAPVRRTEFGDQVQVPGGLWIPCAFSCEYTVRKMHLYYWQDQGAGSVNGLNPSAPRNDFWKDENGRHDYIF
jgi:hypothetical protein